MLKGTRVLMDGEAKDYSSMQEYLRMFLSGEGFSEIILPSVWETQTFLDKLGPSKSEQMWTFLDKSYRDCCLIPEATGILQELYNSDWVKNRPFPIKLFYITRCFRYERPQEGRYREFTQVGVEVLTPEPQKYKEELVKILKDIVEGELIKELKFIPMIKRGLDYYIEDGFEVECGLLGAQKQIAGGGVYKEGVGWAIGLERLLLAKKKSNSEEDDTNINL